MSNVFTASCCLMLASANAALTVTAGLTYHIDASDMNNDSGATNPGDGNAITDWKELSTDTSLNIQADPTWLSTGLNGKATVNFTNDGTNSDLTYSNNPPINSILAQTIFVVASMTSDGNILSNLMSNGSGKMTIRQSTTEVAEYFAGNADDFHSGGSFRVNGDSTFAIAGGFGSAHIVESTRGSAATIASLRIGDNANNRRWNGEVSEIIVYNRTLTEAERNEVGSYLADKYSITSSYTAAPEPSSLALLGLGGLALIMRRRK